MLDSIQECPFCHYKDTARGSADWEENGQRGLLGKTEGEYIMLLCPECRREIKWDMREDVFLKPE